MQLLNDFYTRSNWKQEDENLSCNIAFNAVHDIFKGHFPDHPVVPGVCTMNFIKQALEDAIGKKLTLKEAGSIKFLQLIIPDHEVSMDIAWKESEHGVTVKASLSNEGKPIFKMIALYATIEQ